MKVIGLLAMFAFLVWFFWMTYEYVKRWKNNNKKEE